MRTIGLHGDFGLASHSSDTFLSDSIFSVVEFAWGGCWSFGPTLDELEGKYKQVKFVQVPIESDADLTYIVSSLGTSQYSARDVPAVVLFKGKLNVGVFPQGNLDEIVGAMQKHGFPTGEKPENKLQDKSYLSVSLTNRALENMWNSRALDDANSAVLPPPGHMDDITSQLRVTLLSKTQRKAMKADEVSQLVEPTVALYCPIEGGEHIIDTTIKELAARTNSEVQMIDMAQLAAGEWGAFGTSASGFRFKKNPLGKVKPGEDLDDNDDGESNVQALESFWQKVIDSNPVPATQPAPGHDATGDLTSTSTTPRRRIIYIRDFGLLAPRVSTWFPPLYTAIRARRTGGLGPESQITHPTTVVFGVCPPVSSILPNSAKRELCYEGCDCDSCCPPLKEWDESAVKERTERFKKTKAKLEKGEILEDLPSFRPKIKINQSRVKGVERGEKMTRADSSGVEAKDPAEDLEIEEDGATMSESQAPESNPTNETGQAEDDSSTSDSDDSEVISKSASSATSEPSDEDYTQRLDGYFRSYVVAPAKRNLKLERASRENRRRELSELMLRMVTGVKGGLIEPGAVRLLAREKETGEAEADNGDIQDGMVKEWDEHLAKPDDFKGVVDRALEIAMLSCEDGDDGEDEEQTPVLVSWAQIREAWRANKRSSDERKTWMKCDEEAVVGDEKPPVDEIVEKVKAEDLDEYEQRLTGCIVDVAKLSTTFHNVHLPTHVIDSVRSIVSLPLLFPQSFQSGILKEQAISGALLFGPPGTGKTLLVRALAKESGSRMLAIKPSDIADKWVGETEKLVRSLFSLARRLKPCVVFIDEIDSIMGSRTSSSCDGGSRWHTSMLTEFMQEMDGLMASSVIVIGATNRPFDVDDAVLRRLPYRLLVDLPGIEAREEILKIMLRNDALAPDVDIRKIAQQTERFSGSDLKNLCVSAAMDALKENVKLPWITTGRNTNSLYAKPESAPGSKSTSSTTGTPENSIAIPKPSDDENSCDPSNPESKTPSSPSTSEVAPDKSSGVSKPHILAARHFSRALMDIAPSSSESQNSLSELRKWNTQFGMGTRDQSRFASALPYAYGGINSSTSNSVNLPGANGISSYNPVGLTPGRYAGGLGSLGSSEAVLSGLGTPGAGSVGLNSNSVNALGSNIVGGPGSSRLGALGTNSVNGANGFTSNSQGSQALLTRPPSDIKDALNSHAAKFPGRNQHVALYTPGSTTGNLSET